MFAALRRQGVPEAYVQLLGALFEKQKGSMDGSFYFAILRGVKQRDVLSSMFFSAGLEATFFEWQSQLSTGKRCNILPQQNPTPHQHVDGTNKYLITIPI